MKYMAYLPKYEHLFIIHGVEFEWFYAEQYTLIVCRGDNVTLANYYIREFLKKNI